MSQEKHQSTPEQVIGTEKGHWNILCVDDEKQVLSALKRTLKPHNYKVFVASGAEEALWLLEYQPIDIIISDMMMPGINGAQFLAESRQNSPDSVRILLTGQADLDSTITAINEGKIDHFLQKPWDSEELLRVLAEAIKTLSLQRENAALLGTIRQQNVRLAQLNKTLEERIDLRTQQVRTALNRVERANSRSQANHRNTLRVFFNLISLNENLQGHLAMEISELCRQIALAIGLDHKAVRAIRLSGLLNELGLLCLPDEIASTPIIRMNKEQRALFYSHPIKAAMALEPAIALSNVSLIIKHQYEHIDGSGTPDRIWGDQIPVGARILAICRDYVLERAARGKSENASEDAIAAVNKHAGTRYDKTLLELLPGAIQSYESQSKIDDHEKLLNLDQLTAGIELSRPLIIDGLLLLAENHILTSESIRRLRKYQQSHKKNIEVFVFDRPDTEVEPPIEEDNRKKLSS